MRLTNVVHLLDYSFEVDFDCKDGSTKTFDVELDPSDNTLNIPPELEEYEDTILDYIDENYGDVVDIMRDRDRREFEAYKKKVGEFFS